MTVRLIHEAANVIRRAVEMARREEIDTVVAPSELAREVGDGHDLEARDAEARQLGQLAHGGGPVSLGREGADVHLVDHLAADRRAGPARLAPSERGRIDHARWAGRALRLEAGRRVGIECLVRVELKSIERARAAIIREAGVVTIALGGELQRSSRAIEVHHDPHLPALWCPDTE